MSSGAVGPRMLPIVLDKHWQLHHFRSQQIELNPETTAKRTTCTTIDSKCSSLNSEKNGDDGHERPTPPAEAGGDDAFLMTGCSDLKQRRWADVLGPLHIGFLDGTETAHHIHEILPTALLQDGSGDHASITSLASAG